MSKGVVEYHDANGQRRYTNVSSDGLQRLCTGSAHDEPTWLPNTEKYFYVQRRKTRGTSGLSSRCRLCNNWSKLKSPGMSGWVYCSQVRAFFIEAVNRIGKMELSRRSGVHRNIIQNVIEDKQLRVQKSTVRKIMLELISIRRKGEVRHRDSISYGALRRQPHKQKAHKRKHRFGKMLEIPETVKSVGEEKPVTNAHDLYRPHGDSDNDYKRRSRANGNA